MKKGTALHELLHLPDHWAKMRTVSTETMRVSRHAYGAHFRQYLLCAKPLQIPSKSPRHAIVFFHGGAWRFGTPEQFVAYASFFTSLGYTVFMPSYRRLPLYQFTHLHEDLTATLLEISRLLATENEANPKLIVGGMSAGGHMAAALSHDASVWEAAGFSENPAAAFFACGAPLDLNMLPDSPLLLRLAGRRGSASYQKANPFWHLQQRPEVLPTLCIHGTQDGLVPVACAESFVQLAQQKSTASLHLIEGGTHLDAGRWAYQEDEPQLLIKAWLEQR